MPRAGTIQQPSYGVVQLQDVYCFVKDYRKRQEGERAATFRKPYSVRATNAMGTVEMKQPAMGMKEQMNTNRDSRPRPGIARVHMPAAVSAVFTSAMRACRPFQSISDALHQRKRDFSIFYIPALPTGLFGQQCVCMTTPETAGQ